MLRIVTGGDEEGGNLDDKIEVHDVRVGRAIQIHSGGGNDHLQLSDIYVGAERNPQAERQLGRRASGYVHVSLGDGENSLQMDQLDAGRIMVRGGEGDDDIGLSGTESQLLWIHSGLGEGADSVKLKDIQSQLAGVRTGDGGDDVNVVDSVFKVLGVQLGKSDDSLAMGGVSARLAALSGGPGEADVLENLSENLVAHRRVSGFELPVVDETEPEEKVERV